MFKFPSKISYVLNTLSQKGYEAYIVGGCVRDLLMGIAPHDYDITTNALPEEIIALFPKTVPTGIKHGTVTVISGNEPIEVTTYRTETDYKDHRRPERVRFVPLLKEDLIRRDFTVNAMAYNEKTGLIDYFGGKKDINSKLLKAVGDPYKRFSEDSLRILRLFRFASCLEFGIEENTLSAALEMAETLRFISKERIADELRKAINGKNPTVLRPLLLSGGLEFLNIHKFMNFEALNKLKSAELRFFAFAYLCCEDAASLYKELKLSKREISYCRKLSSLLKQPLPQNKKEIKERLFLSDYKVLEDYFEIFALLNSHNTDNLKALLSEIRKNNEPYLISQLKIDGEILKLKGYNGKEIGDILEHLRKLVLENPQLNDKEKLICEIEKF